MMMLLDVYDVGDDATPPPPTSMGGTDDGRAEGQSSGDSTRRAFVGLLLLALLSRAVLLPVQAWFYYPPPPPGGDGGQGGGGRQPQLRHIEPTSGLCVGSALCVLSRTLPCLTFATAFSLLVLYYAQLAGTAGGGGPRGYWAEALTSRSFFRACNSAMYAVYGLAYLAAAYVPGVPYGLFQTVVWSMLCGVYLALLGCLGWFGPVLLRLLRPSLERRTALALRLSATCAVCAAVFLARAVFLGRAVSRATASWEEVKEEDWDGGRDQVGGHGGGTTDQEEATGGSYQDLNDEVWRRLDGTLLVYALLELLPGAAILAMMMHPGRAGRGGGGGGATPPDQSPSHSLESGGGGTPPPPLYAGSYPHSPLLPQPGTATPPHGGGGGGGLGMLGGALALPQFFSGGGGGGPGTAMTMTTGPIGMRRSLSGSSARPQRSPHEGAPLLLHRSGSGSLSASGGGGVGYGSGSKAGSGAAGPAPRT